MIQCELVPPTSKGWSSFVGYIDTWVGIAASPHGEFVKIEHWFNNMLVKTSKKTKIYLNRFVPGQWICREGNIGIACQWLYVIPGIASQRALTAQSNWRALLAEPAWEVGVSQPILQNPLTSKMPSISHHWLACSRSKKTCTILLHHSMETL